MPPRVLVQGRVRFETGAPDFERAQLRVRLEEVSRADAGAQVLAEQIVDITRPAGDSLPYTLIGEVTLEPGGAYTVRAHIDMDRTGAVTRGDFISTQSYPIDVANLPADIDILVKPVT